MIIKFSPQGGIAKQIINWITNAKNDVYLAIFSITNWDIANALVNAKKRGVTVGVIMDKSQTYGTQAKIHDFLKKNGVNVDLCAPKNGIMHNKFMVVDSNRVMMGSYNFTVKAETSNFENALFMLDKDLRFEYFCEYTFIFMHSRNEVKRGKSLVRFLRRMKLPF